MKLTKTCEPNVLSVMIMDKITSCGIDVCDVVCWLTQSAQDMTLPRIISVICVCIELDWYYEPSDRYNLSVC